MGSLAPGWDSRKPGRVPKSMRDYHDVAPIPEGAEHLYRVSAPGRVSTTARSGSTSNPTSPTAKRASSLHPQPTSAPTTPTGRACSLPISKFAAEGEPFNPHELTRVLVEKETWSHRVDSAGLNAPIDDPEENKHERGHFKLDDPTHSFHLV